MHAKHPGGSYRHGTACLRWKLLSKASNRKCGKMLISNLRMAQTRPGPPPQTEIEQQSEDLLTQADLPSQSLTSPAQPCPASPPITPSPKPASHPTFERFALYGLAGEAVRALAPHTEAQP